MDLAGTCMIEGGSEIHSSQMLPVRLEEAGKLDGKWTRVWASFPRAGSTYSQRTRHLKAGGSARSCRLLHVKYRRDEESYTCSTAYPG